jgi:hypothetical protein
MNKKVKTKKDTPEGVWLEIRSRYKYISRSSYDDYDVIAHREFIFYKTDKSLDLTHIFYLWEKIKRKDLDEDHKVEITEGEYNSDNEYDYE